MTINNADKKQKTAATATVKNKTVHWLTTSGAGWTCHNDLETCLRRQRLCDKDSKFANKMAVWCVPGDSKQAYRIDMQLGAVNRDGSQLEGLQLIATLTRGTK